MLEFFFSLKFSSKKRILFDSYNWYHLLCFSSSSVFLRAMGLFDSVCRLKLILPILFLLLPTALRFLTTTSSNSLSNNASNDNNKEPVLFKPKAAPDHAAASRALLIPEANHSSSSSSSLVIRRKKARRRAVGGPVEDGLSRARAAIRSARNGSTSSSSYSSWNDEMPLPRIYRNPTAFYRSYVEMEKRLKVYVYEEGEAPLVHDGPCKNIYSVEGRFIEEFEMMKGGFRTENPGDAQLFFLPFSVAWMVRYVYDAATHNHRDIKQFVADYVDVVASKHPYWNRTAGADHFMLSCHDWGPSASSANHELFHNSIRALCNANTSEGFRPRKDVSVPEIHLLTGDIPPAVRSPPPPSTPRPILAFFAGRLHGPVRPVLLQHWTGRDPDVQVHQHLPLGVDYFEDYMLKSKFCLCPSGYEVASPRVAEAVYAECVPVLISEGYCPPFSDVLRWEEFSVSVAVEEIPRLKEILSGIGEEEVERLREGVRGVRRHFLLNRPAKRFDAFHMILHSVWLRRLNLRTTL